MKVKKDAGRKFNRTRLSSLEQTESGDVLHHHFLFGDVLFQDFEVVDYTPKKPMPRYNGEKIHTRITVNYAERGIQKQTGESSKRVSGSFHEIPTEYNIRDEELSIMAESYGYDSENLINLYRMGSRVWWKQYKKAGESERLWDYSVQGVVQFERHKEEFQGEFNFCFGIAIMSKKAIPELKDYLWKLFSRNMVTKGLTRKKEKRENLKVFGERELRSNISKGVTKGERREIVKTEDLRDKIHKSLLSGVGMLKTSKNCGVKYGMVQREKNFLKRQGINFEEIKQAGKYTAQIDRRSETYNGVALNENF